MYCFVLFITSLTKRHSFSNSNFYIDTKKIKCLVEVAEDLTSDVLLSGLLVVHDTSRSGKNNETKLSSREKVVDPVLNLANADIEARRDDTSLVNTTVKLNNDLTGTVVIDVLKLTDVTVRLHNLKELDDDLGRGSDEDLSLTSLLGVVNSVKSVSKNGSTGHI